MLHLQRGSSLWMMENSTRQEAKRVGECIQAQSIKHKKIRVFFAWYIFCSTYFSTGLCGVTNVTGRKKGEIVITIITASVCVCVL